MKKILLLTLALSAGPIIAAPNPAQEQFNTANQHYEKGEFDKAFEIYTALTRQGFGGTALYYNLANLSYRLGERGNAVLWYERARRLSPRDADVQFNLSLARSHLKDEDPSWIENVVFSASLNELSIWFSILLWGFFVLLGAVTLGWIQAEIWPGMTLWTTGLLLVLSGTWLGTQAVWDARPTAIVIKAPGEVRNGPGQDYAVGFTVPEGSKVTLLNRRPEWSQIGVPQQGLKGWIPSSEIEPIRIESALDH